MISDDMLRVAAEEYEQTLLSSLPDPEKCNYLFSARFEHKMQRLCHQAKHSAPHTLLKRIACALVIIILCCSIFLMLNTEIRATVISWVKEQYENFANYFFDGETSSKEPNIYYIGWLPDGFEQIDSSNSAGGGSLVYINHDGQILQLTYLFDTDSSNLFVTNDAYIHSVVTVQNQSADIYLAVDPQYTNAIVWCNTNKSVLFYLSAPCNKDALVQIAESVTIVKNK